MWTKADVSDTESGAGNNSGDKSGSGDTAESLAVSGGIGW
jgi:hypothetical protein